MECYSYCVGIATLFLVLESLLQELPTTVEAGGLIGVDYGLYNNKLSLVQTVALLHSKGITRVRRFESKPDVTLAFENARIDQHIGVPNEDVATLAASSDEAKRWVKANVLPFPTSDISAIIVGNEWFYNPLNDPHLLLPAMENIYDALHLLSDNINASFLTHINVSTCLSFNVIHKFFPPSAATFKKSLISLLAPLMDFLDRTGSFFMVDIFPYLLVAAHPQDKALLQFALFNSTQVVQDPYTHLNYTNLFDLQLDAVYAAKASLSTLSSSVPSTLSLSPLSSPSCVCSCVCKSFAACVCSSTSYSPSSSSAYTQVSSSCCCTIHDINSNKDIYQTIAHKRKGRAGISASSGFSSGHGSSRSSPSGRPDYPWDSGVKSENDLGMPSMYPRSGEKKDEISSSMTLLDARFTPLAGMPFSSTLLDYKEIKNLQHELKSFKNHSMVQAAGPSGLSTPPPPPPPPPPPSSSSSPPPPPSTSKHATNSSSPSIKKSVTNTSISALPTTKYCQSLNMSFATSYWNVCASKASLKEVATITNAETYNQNLINHVLEKEGTPANPTTPIVAYVFELFDEAIVEEHYGLFYPNGTPIYPITFNQTMF